MEQIKPVEPVHRIEARQNERDMQREQGQFAVWLDYYMRKKDSRYEQVHKQKEEDHV